MKRPPLNEIPLTTTRTAGGSITNVLIGPGEWDEEIEIAYAEGKTLLEFDGDEKPVRAFKKLQLKLPL